MWHLEAWVQTRLILDIKNIGLVINFDFPSTIQDYIHRIGRTGRAGDKGIAYTFFSGNDSSFARDLVEVG